MTMEQIIFNYQNMLSHMRRAVPVGPDNQSIATLDPLKCVALGFLATTRGIGHVVVLPSFLR